MDSGKVLSDEEIRFEPHPHTQKRYDPIDMQPRLELLFEEALVPHRDRDLFLSEWKRGRVDEQELADEIKGLQPCIKDIKGDEVWVRSEFNATYRMYEQYYGLDKARADEVRQDWVRTLDNTAITANELKVENTIPFKEPPESAITVSYTHLTLPTILLV